MPAADLWSCACAAQLRLSVCFQKDGVPEAARAASGGASYSRAKSTTCAKQSTCGLGVLDRTVPAVTVRCPVEMDGAFVARVQMLFINGGRCRWFGRCSIGTAATDGQQAAAQDRHQWHRRDCPRKFPPGTAVPALAPASQPGCWLLSDPWLC